MSKRFIVYDRQLRPLFDLDGRVTEATRYERINGEHKLDIKTTQPLEEGLRILVRDGTLKWREWVVDEPDERKQDYGIVEGSYGCTWSIQYDLSTVSGGELWPGTYTPITAGAALEMVLATQKRWEVGRVTVDTLAGTSLFDGSVWDYLGKLQEVWGGEIEPRIEVDSNGVTHRYVDWLAHVGNTEATRRFDYGEDCTSIDRKPPVGPMCCRIVPRGGNDATDEDGISYSNRVGVEEEPYSSGDGWVHDAGSIWIRDPDAEQAFRTPNPDGTWHYPEIVVTYDTDDPEELVWLASADIHKYTRPSPTYEADVLQFAAAGMDAHGVELGDVVHIVDKKFGDAPLRIEARIVEMTVNELDESDVQLVIGEATQGIESAFKSMRSAIEDAQERARRIEGGGTIVYLQHLLDEINAEINGTGGYSYFVDGEGIITYDRRVADPLIGTEATQIVQIKGGSIRIANSKKPNFAGINDWDWKTVFVSGHIAAELVTAAHITAGYIGSPDDTVFLDFDNHIFEIGNTSVQQLLQDVASAGIDRIEYGVSASSSTAPTSWSTTAPTSVAKGSWLWIRTIYKDGNSSTTKAYAGTDGQSGDDGTSIASITPQYYLSTSSSSTTGGAWANNPPVWSANHYIWTRNLITWDTTPTTTSTTDEVYDAALTQANKQAADAAKVATDYITDGSNGTDFGKANVNSKVRITNNGMEVFDGNNASVLFAGIQSSKSIVRVGKQSSNGNIYISSDGYIALRYGSTVLAYFGYGDGVDVWGTISEGAYYDIGVRTSGTTKGQYSVVEGYNNTASGYCSHAEGTNCKATKRFAHAEGFNCTASGEYSHAGGYSCTAGDQSFAHGSSCSATGDCCGAIGFGLSASGDNPKFVCGRSNVNYSDTYFEVGCGISSEKKNAFQVAKTSIEMFSYGNTGTVYVNGVSVHSSDKRLKDHVAYLDEDAADFIRSLKPVRYKWKGKDGEHYGFYAQDVQAADPHDTKTVVKSEHTDESLDFDPLTLDYNALIAPLVAYAQQLEKRVNAQDKTIVAMEARLAALEARLA